MNKLSKWMSGLVGVVVLAGCGKPFTDLELADATSRLRDLYFAYDFERGYLEGREWGDKAADAFELRAWYVLHMARTGRLDSAVALAEAMVQRNPASPWSWFALAGTLNQHPERRKEGLEASAKAAALAPQNLDVAWLRAYVLARQNTDSTAVAFIDSLPQALRDDPLMLAARGRALYYLSYRERGTPRKEEAYETFARARERDSTNLDAYYAPGEYLWRDRRNDEALPLLARATELTTAPDMHVLQWQATLSRTDLSADEKHQALSAAADSLLTLRGDLPHTLRTVAEMFGQIEMEDRRLELENRVLEIDPGGPDAEAILNIRARRLRTELARHKEETGDDDAELHQQYRAALQTFIARPYHHRESSIGSAYMELFMDYQEDSTVADDAVYEAVRGMVDHEKLNPHITFAMGASELAERGIHLDEAAQIAQQGMEAGEKRVEEYRASGIFDTEGEMEELADYYASLMTDAQGWVYFHQGQITQAEEKLLEARDLDPDNREVLLHLGRLYEKRAEVASDGNDVAAAEEYLEKAEEHYMKGAMVQYPGENPNDERLKALYQKRTGSLEGWDAYFASIEEIDRAKRREKILAERIAEPEAVEAFALNTLRGDTVAYENLRGRVVVVNFWGTWCGPCVAEMPEYQKFHEDYRDDAGVVVLTISNDDNIDDLRDWMAEHEYDFRVLLDDGYADRVGINAWPTTWFIDPDGKIGFSKRGWSEKLAEEFGWRAEALRGDRE